MVSLSIILELANKPSKEVFGSDDTRPWVPFSPPSGMNSPKKSEDRLRYGNRVSASFFQSQLRSEKNDIFI